MSATEKDEREWAEDAYRDAQIAMRCGPRNYTAEQFAFIEWVVANRKPLDVDALPIDEDERRRT